MTPKLTEKHIQETGRAFLALDGWRLIKTDMPQLRGLGVQEKGIADDLFIRYVPPAFCHNCNVIFLSYKSGVDKCPQCFSVLTPNCGPAEIIWIEWKAPKGKAAQHQLDWHRAERARGALTWIADIDFPASIEGFEQHYFASGLARKVRRQNHEVVHA